MTCGGYETIAQGYANVTHVIVLFKSNRKAMNRNWSNQKANPDLKNQSGK